MLATMDAYCVEIRQEDFASQNLENLSFDGTYVTLLPEATEGTMTTEWIETVPFAELVSWWNAVTPLGTSTETFVRVRVDGKESEFFSWGKWSTGIGRSSLVHEDALASIDTDELRIKDGKTANAIQIKLVLRSNEAGKTPYAFGVGSTWRLNEKPAIEANADRPSEVHLVAPVYSQMIRERDMANVMCSAVTAVTQLNHLGMNLIPEQFALVDYDERYEGYGNWAFTMAAAAAYGFNTQIQYGNLELIRNELAEGRCVGINVAYSNKPDGRYTYIENGAIDSTGGHLLTVTGYSTVDGVDYLDVHDSAASGDRNCVRRYRADQVEKAWSKGICYLVSGRHEGTAPYLTNPIPAELRLENEGYTLYVDGEAKKLSDRFYQLRLKQNGGGIIACCIADELSPLPEDVTRTDANRPFFYDSRVNSEGQVVIGAATLRNAAGKKLVFYIMENTGLAYTAEIQL